MKGIFNDLNNSLLQILANSLFYTLKMKITKTLNLLYVLILYEENENHKNQKKISLIYLDLFFELSR